MREALLGILMAVPLLWAAPAVGQTCDDFSTRIGAQPAYLAGAAWLDGDGNGVACESIEVFQRDSLSVEGAHHEVLGRVGTVTCPDTSFALQDFAQATREGFRGEGSHVEWTTMMQCVELHLAIRQNE